jgi:hypothetical protein
MSFEIKVSPVLSTHNSNLLYIYYLLVKNRVCSLLPINQLASDLRDNLSTPAVDFIGFGNIKKP